MKLRLFSAFAFLCLIFSQLSAQQWGNFTLVALQNNSTVTLIDTNNTVFHTWSLGAAKTGYSAYVLPGGDLIRSLNHAGNSFMGGGITGEIQKVDWAGNVLWDYVYSTTNYCMHHDICPMPNGNVLLISYELKTAAELTQAGSSTSHVIWPDKIVEVQPNGATGGTIVWEWHAWDHLVQNVDASKDNYYPSISDHPELLNINYNNTSTTKDWMHMNGVDYDAASDQIAFSSHFLNEMYVIDHSTTTAEAASHAGGNSGKGGDLLYRWGNPAAYSITGVPATLNTVHDAHFIPADCPKAGYLVGYNNNGISMTQSSVDFVNPPRNGYLYNHTAGQAYTPTTYSNRLACSGHNNNMGNSQQFPNGNTLVCIAQSGKIYEVDSNNVQLWVYTATGTMAQSSRYTPCFISGMPPLAPTITENTGVLSVPSATTYQWYLNGVAISGGTSASYTPTQSGSYQAIVRDANGCASALSEALNFTMTGIENISLADNVKIYPNPTTALINIDARVLGNRAYKVTVSDMYGKIVFQGENTTSIDLSSCANGIYIVSLANENAITLSKKITLMR